MLRFCFVILVSIPYIVYYLRKGAYIERHPMDYTEDDRYRIAINCINVLKRHGFIHTTAYGI